MTRPTFPVPRWATDENFATGPEAGTPTRVEPSSGMQQVGALGNQRVSAKTFNWLHGTATDWLAHVVDTVDALMLRNWIRYNAGAGGYLVLYRKQDGYVYTFDHEPSGNDFDVRGYRTFPADRPNLTDTPVVGVATPVSIPNTTGGIVLSAAAISSSGTMLIGGEPAGDFDLRRSTNGTTWTEVSTGSVANLRSLGWVEAASSFVAGFSGGQIMTSADGLSWTQQTTPNSHARASISSSPDHVVVMAIGTSDGDYIYAPTGDLTDWTAGQVVPTVPVINIEWSDFWGRWFSLRSDGVWYWAPTPAGPWTAGSSIGSNYIAMKTFGRYLLAFKDDGLIRISADGANTSKNLTSLAHPPNAPGNSNYGSIFVGDGIILTAWGEGFPTGNDGDDENALFMTLSAEGLL